MWVYSPVPIPAWFLVEAHYWHSCQPLRSSSHQSHSQKPQPGLRPPFRSGSGHLIEYFLTWQHPRWPGVTKWSRGWWWLFSSSRAGSMGDGDRMDSKPGKLIALLLSSPPLARYYFSWWQESVKVDFFLFPSISRSFSPFTWLQTCLDNNRRTEIEGNCFCCREQSGTGTGILGLPPFWRRDRDSGTLRPISYPRNDR